MKKTILPVLGLIIACLTSTAQFKSGDVLLGGNISFSSTNTTPTTLNGNSGGSAVNFNPTIGFFKNGKTLYSFGLIYSHGISHNLTTSYGTQTNTENSYGINLSKQCFTPIAKNLYFTLAGTFTAFYQDYKVSYDQNPMYQTDKSGFFSVGIAPGISYKINNWLLSDLSLPNLLGVNFTTGARHYFPLASVDTKSTYNTFNFATSLNNSFANSLAIGFRFLLGTKIK